MNKLTNSMKRHDPAHICRPMTAQVGHMIPFEQPELVVNAIIDLLEQLC